jgi:hypothetical protein
MADDKKAVSPEVAALVKRLQETETALLEALGYTSYVQKMRHGPDAIHWVSPKGIDSDKWYAVIRAKQAADFDCDDSSTRTVKAHD